MLIDRRKNDHKKSNSLAGIEIRPGDLVANEICPALILPARAVITSIYAVTEADHDAGVVAFTSVNTAGEDAGLAFDVDQDAVGVTGELLAAPVYTGTGIELRAEIAAEQTTGTIMVVIEYDEPSLSRSGQLTSVRRPTANIAAATAAAPLVI